MQSAATQKKIAVLILIATMLLLHRDSVAKLNETVALSGFSSRIFSEDSSTFIVESDCPDFALTDSPFQKTVSTKRGSKNTVLTVKTGSGAGVASSPGDRASLLRDTRFLTINDPQIAAKARSCAASDDPVNAVEEFVFTTISQKMNGIPLLPALNILKNRSGDCTEHAVLAVSLLRAQKIPCRAIVGMIFVGDYLGEKNVFVFHMWAEAWHHGSWRLVDATRPGDKKPNLYIAFARHSLETETPLAYLRAVSAIQNLKVRYLK